MIGKLSGRVDTVGADHLVLDVGGVGYEVHCMGSLLRTPPAPGDFLALYIETRLRSDQLRLYGFLDPAEKTWFSALQGVQGVGARVALSLLSTFPPAQLGRLIAVNDRKTLATADGVGPRLAQRLITELKDRALPAGGPVPLPLPRRGFAPDSPPAGAISALVNLGYRRAEAETAVARALERHPDYLAGDHLGDLIRAALKELAR